jgi:hypothetical protein
MRRYLVSKSVFMTLRFVVFAKADARAALFAKPNAKDTNNNDNAAADDDDNNNNGTTKTSNYVVVVYACSPPQSSRPFGVQARAEAHRRRRCRRCSRSNRRTCVVYFVIAPAL